MALIYHITAASDWAQARRDGAYRLSTLGRSLADEGFIHASTAPQVAPVANAFYQGASDLLVLFIDTDRVQPEIRYEHVPGLADPFPHIYGPLNVDAVTATVLLERDASGRFTFAPGRGSRPG
jgi:uncharacterized protein (DUF952 family)